MNLLNIKALSINEAFQGRRFKTQACKAYEEELLYLLPNIKVPKGKLKLEIEVGLSSKNADLDNISKIFIDCLQKRYNFNDRRIYILNQEKHDVEKGKEFIKFNLKTK